MDETLETACLVFLLLQQCVWWCQWSRGRKRSVRGGSNAARSVFFLYILTLKKLILHLDPGGKLFSVFPPISSSRVVALWVWLQARRGLWRGTCLPGACHFTGVATVGLTVVRTRMSGERGTYTTVKQNAVSERYTRRQVDRALWCKELCDGHWMFWMFAVVIFVESCTVNNKGRRHVTRLKLLLL
jgi:hypothetical protein